MKSCIFLTLFLLAGCERPVTPKYVTHTARDVAKAWSEAYNHDEPGQLRLLVHPQKRLAFDRELPRLKTEMERHLVKAYEIRDPVVVNERLPGFQVDYAYTDGRGEARREAVVIEDEGRWWVWRF